MRLAFGHKVHEGVRAAWGARLIVGQDGHVDLVHDRQDAQGDWADLKTWLDGGALREALDNLSDMLKSYEVKTREDSPVTLYRDDDGKIVGNTNASGGYFYIAGWLFKDEGLTAEELRDQAEETVRGSRGDPTEPCVEGHFDCAYSERGACTAALVAAEYARLVS